VRPEIPEMWADLHALMREACEERPLEVHRCACGARFPSEDHLHRHEARFACAEDARYVRRDRWGA
jgi:hypothetical protein